MWYFDVLSALIVATGAAVVAKSLTSERKVAVVNLTTARVEFMTEREYIKLVRFSRYRKIVK